MEPQYIAVIALLAIAFIVSIIKYFKLKNNTNDLTLSGFLEMYKAPIIELCKETAEVMKEEGGNFTNQDEFTEFLIEKVITKIKTYSEELGFDLSFLKLISDKDLATIIRNIIYFKGDDIVASFFDIGADAPDIDEILGLEDDTLGGHRKFDPLMNDSVTKTIQANDKVNIGEAVEGFYTTDTEA